MQKQLSHQLKAAWNLKKSLNQLPPSCLWQWRVHPPRTGLHGFSRLWSCPPVWLLSKTSCFWRLASQQLNSHWVCENGTTFVEKYNMWKGSLDKDEEDVCDNEHALLSCLHNFRNASGACTFFPAQTEGFFNAFMSFVGSMLCYWCLQYCNEAVSYDNRPCRIGTPTRRLSRVERKVGKHVSLPEMLACQQCSLLSFTHWTGMLTNQTQSSWP